MAVEVTTDDPVLTLRFNVSVNDLTSMLMFVWQDNEIDLKLLSKGLSAEADVQDVSMHTNTIHFPAVNLTFSTNYIRLICSLII